jgi:hypothetical protein
MDLCDPPSQAKLGRPRRIGVELGDELIGHRAVAEKLVGDEDRVAPPVRLRFERLGRQQEEKRGERQNESVHWREGDIATTGQGPRELDAQ